MDQQTILTASALAVAALSLVLALTAHRRLWSMRRSLTVLQANADGRTMIEAVNSYAADVGKLAGNLEAVARRQEDLFAMLGRSPRNVGLVRYDAFEDMGGRMSFSAAFLDDGGNGIVLTSINARTEARTYAKTVRGGQSDHNLSPEEKEAITRALGQGTKVRRRR